MSVNKHASFIEASGGKAYLLADLDVVLCDDGIDACDGVARRLYTLRDGRDTGQPGDDVQISQRDLVAERIRPRELGLELLDALCHVLPCLVGEFDQLGDCIFVAVDIGAREECLRRDLVGIPLFEVLVYRARFGVGGSIKRCGGCRVFQRLLVGCQRRMTVRHKRAGQTLLGLPELRLAANTEQQKVRIHTGSMHQCDEFVAQRLSLDRRRRQDGCGCSRRIRTGSERILRSRLVQELEDELGVGDGAELCVHLSRRGFEQRHDERGHGTLGVDAQERWVKVLALEQVDDLEVEVGLGVPLFDERETRGRGPDGSVEGVERCLGYCSHCDDCASGGSGGWEGGPGFGVWNAVVRAWTRVWGMQMQHIAHCQSARTDTDCITSTKTSTNADATT
ncbi:hypothetical protein L1887_48161 [Cichorium endivia]|nr:hypothetical protein L1887_48161 [Cichorium endivia]